MYNGHWKVYSFGHYYGEFRTAKLAERFCNKQFGKNWDDIDNCKAIISRRV